MMGPMVKLVRQVNKELKDQVGPKVLLVSWVSQDGLGHEGETEWQEAKDHSVYLEPLESKVTMVSLGHKEKTDQLDHPALQVLQDQKETQDGLVPTALRGNQGDKDSKELLVTEAHEEDLDERFVVT